MLPSISSVDGVIIYGVIALIVIALIGRKNQKRIRF